MEEEERNKVLSLRSRRQIISLGVFKKPSLLEKRVFSGFLKRGRRKSETTVCYFLMNQQNYIEACE